MGVISRTIDIDPLDEEEVALWKTVARIAGHLGPDRDWCLVGGLMVQLHAYERAASSRPTRDIDLLGNVRKRPSMTVEMGRAVEELGGTIADPPSTNPKLGYRFFLDGQMVDVLGSDGLRTPGLTLGRRETIEVPGATQALRRVELVAVRIASGDPVTVRRPSLLGAILLKARALLVHDRFEDQRRDLILLLGFVEDPRALASDLKGNERGWLRKAADRLNLGDPELEAEYSGETLRTVDVALELLTQAKAP